MNMKELFENATPEQKEKIINCKSAEELLQFAKSEDMNLNAEEAAELFSAICSKTGEINDNDLNKVSGGKRTTPAKCPYCGCLDLVSSPGGYNLCCTKCKRIFEEAAY